MQPGGLMRLIIGLVDRKTIQGDLDRIARQLDRLEAEATSQAEETFGRQPASG
jgi:hypothetical protein